MSSEVDLGNVRLFLDTMDNKANETFAALPERLYVLHNDRVSYIGGLGPLLYCVSEVENWLRAFAMSKTKMPAFTRKPNLSKREN